MQALQPPQKPPHPGAGEHALAVRAVRAQPVGRLHLAQPPHSGGPDGIFDRTRAAFIAFVGVMAVGLSAEGAAALPLVTTVVVCIRVSHRIVAF